PDGAFTILENVARPLDRQPLGRADDAPAAVIVRGDAAVSWHPQIAAAVDGEIAAGARRRQRAARVVKRGLVLRFRPEMRGRARPDRVLAIDDDGVDPLVAGTCPERPCAIRETSDAIGRGGEDCVRGFVEPDRSRLFVRPSRDYRKGLIPMSVKNSASRADPDVVRIVDGD